MKFIMNENTWIIKEVSQEEFWKDDNALDKMNNSEYYFGRCHFNTQEIWLWKDASIEQKTKTLYHELTHCYRGSYITFADLNHLDEDIWCDIIANSHNIIDTIANDYFTHHDNGVNI